MTKNRLRLDLTNSPELQDLFSTKKLGETCELTVEFQISDITSNEVVGTIKSVTDYEDDMEDDAEEKTPEPMMEISMSDGEEEQ